MSNALQAGSDGRFVCRQESRWHGRCFCTVDEAPVGAMLDGELESHLDEEKASGVSNRCNDKSKKTVRVWPAVVLSWRQARTARAVLSRRLSSNDSESSPRNWRTYVRRMGTRAISHYIRAMYATEKYCITDSVLPAVTE